MRDFVWFMIFSGMEFASVFLLVFSVFNIDYKYYLKESLVGTILVTLLSYFLTITELYKIIPMPLILTILICVIIKYFFKKSLRYSIIVSLGSSLMYGVIQLSMVNFAVAANFIGLADVNNAFHQRIYFLQFFCSIVAFVVGFFIKLCHGGFGFRVKNYQDNFMVMFIISLFFISTILSYDFLIQHYNGHILLVASIIMSTLILAGFMKKQEEFEFNVYSNKEVMK